MLERAENEGFEWQKRTKTSILCSGMVAASPAAPTGAHRLQLGTAAVHTAEELPQKATAVALPPACIPPANLPAGHTTARWVLPRDGSRAQRAGDSDVGANDKGAGDDPGDGVDAH